MGFQGVAPILEEGVSSVTATNSVELGTRAVYNGESYVYAYNNTGSSVTQGALMTVSAISGYSFTRSTTASLDVAVCAVKHAAVPAGSYFWGLTQGVVIPLSGVAVAAGDLVVTGTDGAIKTAVTGYTGPVVGKVLTAATANGGGSLLFRAFI